MSRSGDGEHIQGPLLGFDRRQRPATGPGQIEQRGENVLLLDGDTDAHQTQGGGALRALLVFQQRLDFGHLAQG